MAKFTNVDERVWKKAEIVGNNMERCTLWHDGCDVSASLVPMSKEMNLGFHKHETWIHVFIVSGKVRVLPDNRVIDAGGYYFVERGDVHNEIAEEDSLVLLIREEPNVQYPVSEKDIPPIN